MRSVLACLIMYRMEKGKRVNMMRSELDLTSYHLLKHKDLETVKMVYNSVRLVMLLHPCTKYLTGFIPQRCTSYYSFVDVNTAKTKLKVREME